MSRWLQSGIFHPEPEGTAQENFSIAVPPPNVTGVLHMGHALNGSVQDTLMRYHRMLGQHAKWIFGTDHAGIATQRQVEKLLESEGSGREDLGRERFIERVWEWRRGACGRAPRRRRGPRARRGVRQGQDQPPDQAAGAGPQGPAVRLPRPLGA